MRAMRTWDDLYADLTAGRRVIAGVLSGTSADGIDVGLVRPTFTHGRLTRVECAAFATEPFEPALAARVHAALQGRSQPPLGPRELTLLDRDLGRAFGHAARAVAIRHGTTLGLVASHGQTVWHHDGVEPTGAATLQLGDGDEVAEASGAAVACDFRRRDIAAGGGGAPLSALVDPIVFEHVPRPLCLLNLGGIANVTFVRKSDAGEEIVAFDVGPANALLDGLARRLISRSYDADGALAARGAPSDTLVAEVLAHPYFAAPPPKSTGRDTFGAAWLDGVASRAEWLGLDAADTLASAARAVARAVATDVARWGPWLGDAAALRPLVVAGGGVHHRPLLAALAAELNRMAAPRPVVSSATVGVPPDGREALVFAALGARCLVGEPSTRPGATGAAPGRVLGKLVWPP
jgi:anhydro-N-acetylmuramic acid kinase